MRYECALECCPCRDQCSNRQLQDGATLVTAVIDCGCKGVGVIALEDVQAGQFVGEYVGEVLSSREAKLRCQVCGYNCALVKQHGADCVQCYRGAKHAYMLQVNADKVIDATRFGGRMRFVNHSCEPNCRVEKWSVRGQERCGVFAICRVKAGNELTFDYRLQYVDVGVSKAQH